MLKKSTLLSFFYLTSSFSLIIFNHIILSKILLFLLFSLFFLKTLQRFNLLPLIAVYLLILCYFLYLYWQLTLSNALFNLGIYNYIIIKQMFVHFCNTAKAYIISLRLNLTSQLVQLFLSFIIFYFFICAYIII